MRERNYSLELLRVTAMLGVVILHIGGGIAPLCIRENKIIIRLVLALFYCSVDIFALLSGFLKYNKKNKTSSLLNILFTMFFWSFLITCSLILFMRSSVGIREIITYALPFVGGRLWYISCYTFAFFVFPLINKLLEVLEQEIYKKFLFISFIFLSVICTFGVKDYFNCVSNGYSSVWLLWCYATGGYLGKYLQIEKIPRISVLLPLLIVNNIIMVISTFFVEILFSFLEKKPTDTYLYILYRYNSPFTVLNTLLIIFIILKFIKIECSGAQKIVRWLSSVSLGVYVIHAHPFFLDKVFVVRNLEWLLKGGTFLFLVKLFIFSFCVYLLTGFLEYIRQRVFRVLKVDVLITIIGNKIDKKL